MLVYLSLFFLSFILLWSAEKHKFGSITYNFLSSIALLLPIVVAGLRSIGVGTDTAGYTKLLYEAVSQVNSFKDYLNYQVFSVYHFVYVGKWEIGYTGMVYIVTKIFKSYQAVLFVTQLLIILPIYFGLRPFRNRIPICFGMLVYYFMFYCISLNLMRQSIAVSILFCFFHYLVEKKYLKYIIGVVIASLFHISALMGFILLAIYWYSTHNGKGTSDNLSVGRKNSDIKRVIFFGLVCLLFLLSMGIIIKILSAAGLSYYVGYIIGNLKIMPNQIIRRIPWIILLLISWKQLRERSALQCFYACMLIFDITMSQLSSVNIQSGRISLFFSIFYILMIPEACRSIRGKYSKPVIFFSVIYMCALWVYDIVYLGATEVIPYTLCF